MDHARPITALFPGARGAVLDTLIRVRRGMTIRQLADRAGFSHPQVSRHVADLEHLGIVRREHVGRSHVITLTEVLAVEPLRRLVGLRHDVLAAMRQMATSIDPRPREMTVFGSFARGDDGAESDIDVLVVVDDGTPEGAIDASLTDWCDRVAGLTGNAVAEIVVRSSEVASLDPSLRSEMRRDGIPLIP